MSYKAPSLLHTNWQRHGYHLYSGNPRRFCSLVTTSKRLMLHTRPNWMPFSSTDRVMLRLILPIEGDCRLWNRSARFISIKVRVRNWVRRSDDFFLGPKKEKISYLSGCVSLVEMHSIARRFALEIDVYIPCLRLRRSGHWQTSKDEYHYRQLSYLPRAYSSANRYIGKKPQPHNKFQRKEKEKKPSIITFSYCRRPPPQSTTLTT